MENVFYGPVYIKAGAFKGKIGCCDDDDTEVDGNEKGVVYFGDPLVTNNCTLIEWKNIDHITTDRLMTRRGNLLDQLSPYSEKPLAGKKRVEALEEFHYIDQLLADRFYQAKLSETKFHASVFISHSSKDKQFAKWISVDLRNIGHKVWLDEWAILVGESIPKKIEVGIEECDFLILVLSDHAVKSHWVEREWHAKYWDEVEKDKVYILPALKEQCEIPSLLKSKRYADFTKDYSSGLEDLIYSINKLKGSRG